MRHPKKESAGAAPGGFPESVHQATQSLPQTAMADKAVAVWLYCIGARSLGETQTMFDRRPSWRAA